MLLTHNTKVGIFMEIEMDLVSNWQDNLIEDMKGNGLQFSTSSPKDLLIKRYFTYLRKKGGTKPRKVHKSKEFVCPPAHIDGLQKLEHAVRTSGDISPYLSTKVGDITFLDRMFNEWNILHLHLGNKPYPKDERFIDRTGPLLFLYLHENDAYFINVYEHQKDWTNKSVLQILFNN